MIWDRIPFAGKVFFFRNPDPISKFTHAFAYLHVDPVILLCDWEIQLSEKLSESLEVHMERGRRITLSWWICKSNHTCSSCSQQSSSRESVHCISLCNSLWYLVSRVIWYRESLKQETLQDLIHKHEFVQCYRVLQGISVNPFHTRSEEEEVLWPKIFTHFFALSYTQSKREHLIFDFVFFSPAQKPVTSIRETGKCEGSSKKEKPPKRETKSWPEFRWQQEEWCIVVRQKSVQLLVFFHSLIVRSFFLYLFSWSLCNCPSMEKRERGEKRKVVAESFYRLIFVLSSHTFCMRYSEIQFPDAKWKPFGTRKWKCWWWKRASGGKAGHGNEEWKERYIRIIDEHVTHRFTDLTGKRPPFSTWNPPYDFKRNQIHIEIKNSNSVHRGNWSASHRESFHFACYDQKESIIFKIRNPCRKWIQISTRLTLESKRRSFLSLLVRNEKRQSGNSIQLWGESESIEAEFCSLILIRDPQFRESDARSLESQIGRQHLILNEEIRTERQLCPSKSLSGSPYVKGWRGKSFPRRVSSWF